jgi:hypothetical protein
MLVDGGIVPPLSRDNVKKIVSKGPINITKTHEKITNRGKKLREKNHTAFGSNCFMFI